MQPSKYCEELCTTITSPTSYTLSSLSLSISVVKEWFICCGAELRLERKQRGNFICCLSSTLLLFNNNFFFWIRLNLCRKLSLAAPGKDINCPVSGALCGVYYVVTEWSPPFTSLHQSLLREAGLDCHRYLGHHKKNNQAAVEAEVVVQ